ncbi:glycosyltransferase [Aquincola tertiaricarbonis]|uniref:glycosyltransferase n=1 Tax=Aquincola tertiaricarbonis TaxID=391953 RepID=UPI000614D34F|nr:glycosyltransferase [Aquincola tertiaricarbonis]
MTHIGVLMGLYGRDRADLFERALLSVLDQALPANVGLRIYLGVDGPLPPELEAVLARFQGRLHLVSRSHENLGLAATLNRLIAARSDEAFFFRMDADDVSLPGRFTAQLAYLDAHPDIDILGTAIRECREGQIGPQGEEGRVVKFAKDPEDARRRIDRRVPVAHPTVCLRRRVLDTVGGYPERRGNEDIAMWFRCITAGFKFDNLPDPWLDFTITENFWKRRSLEKAFIEFQSYVEGIWRLDGFTWRYAYPTARLCLRLSPEWISRRLYASRMRA